MWQALDLAIEVLRETDATLNREADLNDALKEAEDNNKALDADFQKLKEEHEKTKGQLDHHLLQCSADFAKKEEIIAARDDIINNQVIEMSKLTKEVDDLKEALEKEKETSKEISKEREGFMHSNAENKKEKERLEKEVAHLHNKTAFLECEVRMKGWQKGVSCLKYLWENLPEGTDFSFMPADYLTEIAGFKKGVPLPWEVPDEDSDEEDDAGLEAGEPAPMGGGQFRESETVVGESSHQAQVSGPEQGVPAEEAPAEAVPAGDEEASPHDTLILNLPFLQ